MRQIITKISAVVLFLCAVAGVYLYFGERGAVVFATQFPAPVKIPVTPTSAAQNTEPFPINQRRVVELTADKGLLAEFSSRERHDQYLDWLLFTALSELIPSAEELNRTTFDLPTVREGYMRPLGNFEYGRTRSRYIGDGTVLALVPTNTDANTRKDDLAHIADEHRKNLGRPFDRLRVIEYELSDDAAIAALTLRADIEFAVLFSPAYGYFEQNVETASDLAAFMGRVDDLVAATKTANGLSLGGRRVLGRRSRQITVEEIATVWKAERKIQTALDAFDARVQKAVDAFHSEWSGRTYRTSFDRAQIEKQRDKALDELQDKIVAERNSLKLINGSGFSLDPTFDFDTLVKQASDLDGVIKVLRKPDNRNANSNASEDLKLNTALDAIAGAGSTDIIVKGLKSRDVVPLLIIQDKLKDISKNDKAADFLATLLDFLVEKNKFQAARYDGDLQGTEAGMVLFYTDLLAKIWVIDYLKSAPTTAIPGFVDGPAVPSSYIYKEENKELNEGRLWFGQSDLGFQLTPSRDTVLFARIATRVYSAGHNPLNPGVEKETSVRLGVPIIWWNDHYEEIAKYEQEYERLNQIMKWSIVVGWLNESRSADKLGYLADVPVDRTKRLPAWAAQHSELRFKQWNGIEFFPTGYHGTSTEAIPMLAGSTFETNGSIHQLSGGVSLAPKAVFKGRVPIASDFDRTLLRSNINYGAEGAVGRKITTLEDTVYNFNVREPNVVSLAAKAKPEAKLRAKTAELSNTDVHRDTVRIGGAVRMQTRLGETPIGDLEIAPTQNGFRVGWQSREIDTAHTVARRMSVEANPVDVLVRHPDVMAIIRLPSKDDFLVQLRGSERWLRFSAEDEPTRDLGKEWMMRAADYNGAQRDLRVAVLAKPQDVMAAYTHVAIEGIGDDGKVVVRLGDQDALAGAKLIDVDTGAGSVKVWVDPQTDAVNIAVPARDLPADLLSFVRRFGRTDLAAIRAAARRPGVGTVRLEAVSVARSRFAAVEATRNVDQAARDIVTNPIAARQAVDRQLVAELKANADILAADGPAEAIRHFDGLVELYGPLPELTLRRGLLHIDANQWSDAVASLGHAPRPMRGQDIFFDEINHRLANQGLPTQAQSNLYRYAEYADFQDHLLAHRRDLGDIILPSYHNETFDFVLQLGKKPDMVGPQTVDVAKVRSGKAVIYRQDTPGLNNLDWTVSIDQTLQQVIEGRLGKVVILPRGDVAHFRPSAIYNADGNVTLHKVTSQSHVHIPTSSYSACSLATQDCSDNAPANDNSSDQVYLVVTN